MLPLDVLRSLYVAALVDVQEIGSANGGAGIPDLNYMHKQQYDTTKCLF